MIMMGRRWDDDQRSLSAAAGLSSNICTHGAPLQPEQRRGQNAARCSQLCSSPKNGIALGMHSCRGDEQTKGLAAGYMHEGCRGAVCVALFGPMKCSDACPVGPAASITRRMLPVARHVRTVRSMVLGMPVEQWHTSTHTLSMQLHRTAACSGGVAVYHHPPMGF